jgi:hypothetical protein
MSFSEVLLHTANEKLIFGLQVSECLFKFLLESLEMGWYLAWSTTNVRMNICNLPIA